MSTLVPDPTVPRPEPLTAWRERLLLLMLRGAAVLGLVALILVLAQPVPLPMKLIAASIYVALVAAALIPGVPYGLRTAVFLLFIYAAALGLLYEMGPATAYILFLSLIAMTALLIATPVAPYIAISICLASLLILGGEGVTLDELLRRTGIWLMVSVAMTIGLHIPLGELQKRRESSRQLQDSLEKERGLLEKRIEERTARLTQKTEQFRAATYIARKTAEVQDLPSLLSTVVRLVSDQFGAYHTGVFLLDQSGDRLILHAASSEGGERMVQNGYAVPIGSPGLPGYVAAQKRGRIGLDVGPEAVVFNHPELPLTRSQACLPLIVRSRLLGVLDIQSEKPDAFTGDDFDVLQTLADQIATAIENSRLLEETQAAILQLEALTSLRTREAWGEKLRARNRAFTYTPLGVRAEKTVLDHKKAIHAPILLRGQRIGSIAIIRKGDASWSKSDRELLEEVTSQVGLALDNIRLLEEATLRARQEQLVGKLAARFSRSLDLDTLLQTAARELAQLPDVAEASVFVGGDKGYWDRASGGVLTGNRGYRYDHTRMEALNQLPELAHAAVTSGTVTSSNGSSPADSQEHIVAIPIKLRGQITGVISLKLREGYDRNILSIAEQATERLAAAMESARLFEEARLRADREQSIARVTAAIGTSTEYEQILQTTVREIGNILGDAEVAIQIFDEPPTGKKNERREP